MPEEFFILAILFVAFPWVLIRGIIAIRKSKAPDRSGRGEGLKASDLRAIVEDAVASATEPLHDRIDTLEGLLMGETLEQSVSRRERVSETLLEGELDEDFADDPAPRRRRRVAA